LYLRSGEVIRLEKSGGGGIGKVAERPFELIVGDVLDGYVSVEAAVRDYGVDAARLQAAVDEWRSAGKNTAAASKLQKQKGAK
jgi:N-methylhydantoinase B